MTPINNDEKTVILFQETVLEELRNISHRMDRLEESNKRLEASNESMSALLEAGLARNHKTAHTAGFVRSSTVIGSTKHRKEAAIAIAEIMYGFCSNNYQSNLYHVDQIIGEEHEFFAPIVQKYPNFNHMMCYVMVNSFGVSVKSVSSTLKVKDWGKNEGMRVGSSLAVFIRKRKTGDAALDAWRRHYVQLKALFLEVDGFEEFMLVFANHLMVSLRKDDNDLHDNPLTIELRLDFSHI